MFNYFFALKKQNKIKYDLIEPIKLDYSLIMNHNSKNESEQKSELFFLKTNYLSHFFSWCEMLNNNNFNIKSYSDLKYFMKKYSINTNLLFFSLFYIRNEDISDIIQIHLLLKIINLLYIKEIENMRNMAISKILLYIKNILYPHELTFGNETKNFNNFYSVLLFYMKVLFLKLKLIDDYMDLGILNSKTESHKENRDIFLKKIKELGPGIDSPKEFLKSII